MNNSISEAAEILGEFSGIGIKTALGMGGITRT